MTTFDASGLLAGQFELRPQDKHLHLLRYFSGEVTVSARDSGRESSPITTIEDIGNIGFDEQVLIGAIRTPDFVAPDYIADSWRPTGTTHILYKANDAFVYRNTLYDMPSYIMIASFFLEDNKIKLHARQGRAPSDVRIQYRLYTGVLT